MNDGREKFEQWCEKEGVPSFAHSERAFEIWKAGAESMRQEIIPLVYGMCESDNVAARTVEAIRKIEA